MCPGTLFLFEVIACLLALVADITPVVFVLISLIFDLFSRTFFEVAKSLIVLCCCCCCCCIRWPCCVYYSCCLYYYCHVCFGSYEDESTEVSIGSCTSSLISALLSINHWRSYRADVYFVFTLVLSLLMLSLSTWCCSSFYYLLSFYLHSSSVFAAFADEFSFPWSSIAESNDSYVGVFVNGVSDLTSQSLKSSALTSFNIFFSIYYTDCNDKHADIILLYNSCFSYSLITTRFLPFLIFRFSFTLSCISACVSCLSYTYYEINTRKDVNVWNNL